MTRSFPVVDKPPACSMMKDIGAPSYNKRSFPLGFLVSPGYPKTPPYNKVRCTSPT
eukprot:CAMPEP_0178876044 /NCGR_PEP_ID=MMETSP0747-20121128/10084_1 /TAXON_ID=913974 /ORGANISM="Nitzschia punctata, Strain CCMP561" /LENGTH=55 /DNA_ID=CAMNT_0020543573 /DNA_START=138 /DNA_END=301 /DNA_ORIENTATION=-